MNIIYTFLLALVFSEIIYGNKNITWICSSDNPYEAIYWSNVTNFDYLKDVKTTYVDQIKSLELNTSVLTHTDFYYPMDVRWEESPISTYNKNQSKLTYKFSIFLENDLKKLCAGNVLERNKWFHLQQKAINSTLTFINYECPKNISHSEFIEKIENTTLVKEWGVSRYINFTTIFENRFNVSTNDTYMCLSFFFHCDCLVKFNIINEYQGMFYNASRTEYINYSWKYVKLCSEYPLGLNFTLKINATEYGYINYIHLCNHTERRFIKYMTQDVNDNVVCMQNGNPMLNFKFNNQSLQKYQKNCNLNRKKCESEICYICCDGVCYNATLTTNSGLSTFFISVGLNVILGSMVFLLLIFLALGKCGNKSNNNNNNNSVMINEQENEIIIDNDIYNKI